MGFIEDERRRQAAKLDDQRRKELSYGQQENERKQREASEEVTRKAQAAKSAQQFKQSGLGEMIREAGRLHMHQRVYNAYHFNDKDFPIGSFDGSVNITVSEGKPKKMIDIETTPDGTITIQGGLLGSTTLSKSQWSSSNGREILEKALGKAYKHPKSVKDKPFIYSPPPPPSDYSERAGPGSL